MLQSLFQRAAISRLPVDGVERATAKLRGKESADADLHADVNRRPAELLTGPAGRAAPGLGEFRGGRVGQVLDPLRHFNGRVLATALTGEELASILVEGREQLRVERADVPEHSRSGSVAVR